MAKSIFDPHHDGPSLSGLDTFTGQPGQSFSNMPDELVDGKVEAEEEVEPQSSDVVDASQTSAPPGHTAVDEIAAALDELHLADPAEVRPPSPRNAAS